MSTSTQNRKRAAVAASATVALGASAAPLIFPAGASAASKANCSGDRLCLYSERGFGGGLTERTAMTDSTYTNDTYWGNPFFTLNDTVSAIWNLTGRWARFYRHAGYGGEVICFPPATGAHDLGLIQMKVGTIITSGQSWNNQISAHSQTSYRPSNCNSEAAGTTMIPEGQYGCSL